MRRMTRYHHLGCCFLLVALWLAASTAASSLTLTCDGRPLADITMEALKQLPSHSRDVALIDSPVTLHVTGVKLADLLAHYGLEKNKLVALRLVAGDGFSVILDERMLRRRTVILAWSIDNQPLPAKSRPVRVVVPGERAMFWVRNLQALHVRCTLTTHRFRTIAFLDGAGAYMPTSPYKHYGDTMKAIAVGTLFPDLADATGSLATIVTRDGVTKREKPEILRQGVITLEGKHAPAFMSSNLPKGMQVKHIHWLAYTGTVYVSLFASGTAPPPANITGQELCSLLRMPLPQRVEVHTAEGVHTLAGGFAISRFLPATDGLCLEYAGGRIPKVRRLVLPAAAEPLEAGAAAVRK